MSFVNEIISTQDFEKYKIQEIDKKVGPVGFTSARDWTIDRERDIYIRCVRRGREETRSQTGWTFYWKGHLLWVQLEMLKVLGVAGGPRTACWKLVQLNEMGVAGIGLPPNLRAHRDEILEHLREALLAENGGGIHSSIKEYRVELEIAEGI